MRPARKGVRECQMERATAADRQKNKISLRGQDASRVPANGRLRPCAYAKKFTLVLTLSVLYPFST